MNYAIKDAANVIFYRKADMKPAMYSDYLNSFALSLSSEAVFAKAKGMNKIAFDGTKEGTVTMEAEVYELKLMAMMLGTQFKDQKSEVSKREVVEVIGNKVTLAEAPLSDSIAVFKVDRDERTHLEELTVTNTTDKKITLSGSTTDNTKVVVYYLTEKAKTKRLTVSGECQSENYVLVGETVVRNEFGEEDFVQIKVCNCKPKTSIEIELGADKVATFKAEFDLLADEKNKMVELTLIED